MIKYTINKICEIKTRYILIEKNLVNNKFIFLFRNNFYVTDEELFCNQYY